MKKRILVIASSNMNMVLNIHRIPGAGETVYEKGNYAFIPGGRGGNVAVAVSKLGGDCVLSTRLGNDACGNILKKFYANSMLDTRFVKTDTALQTGLCVIFAEANSAGRMTVYPGANDNLCNDDIEEAFMCYPDALYANFEIPFASLVTACKYARKQEIPIFIDACHTDNNINLSLLGEITALSLNESEAYAFTSIMPTTMENCLRAASELHKKAKAKYIVIKLGDRGSFVYDGIHYNVISPYEVDVADKSAAGDAFGASLTLEYLRCGDITLALRYANAAAAITVSRNGSFSSLPSGEEVTEFIKSREII